MKMRNPEMEVVRFGAEDVIATSGDPLCSNGDTYISHGITKHLHVTDVNGDAVSYEIFNLETGELVESYTYSGYVVDGSEAQSSVSGAQLLIKPTMMPNDPGFTTLDDFNGQWFHPAFPGAWSYCGASHSN